MKERVVQFDENNRLAGIACYAKGARENTPIVIFPNAGIVHRIGPNRLHVKLARDFSEIGCHSLRFDLSGLGESAAGQVGISYEGQAVRDIKQAIDHAYQLFGIGPIILSGICSGADYAYQAALHDDRIKGVILLDPHAYRNKSAQFSDLAKRAQDPERWKRAAQRLVSPSSQEDNSIVEPESDENDRATPSREKFGADIEQIAKQGTELMSIYTSSVRHLINQSDQFFQTFKEFDFQNRLEVEVWPDIDHTYTEITAQSKLTKRLVMWLQTKFLIS